MEEKQAEMLLGITLDKLNQATRNIEVMTSLFAWLGYPRIAQYFQMTSNSLRGFLEIYQDKLPGAVLENYQEREIAADAELLEGLKKTIKFGKTLKLLKVLRLPLAMQQRVLEIQAGLYERGRLRLK